MIQNILVGIMVAIAVGAGIWGWRLENGGGSTQKTSGEDSTENTEPKESTNALGAIELQEAFEGSINCEISEAIDQNELIR